jgi:N-glycosylase/DNA lyase
VQSVVKTWSLFAPVAGVPPLTPAVLAETLDGGQAFRWRRETEGDVGGVPSPRAGWLGQWADHVVRLRLAPGGTLEFSAPAATAPQVAAALTRYLAADRDWAALADSLPWRSDAHLARCLAPFPGLRILRQPFGETLLGFLCSATKQIVQIKEMLALLAVRHGAPVVERVDPNALSAAANPTQRVEVNPPHRLPTWSELTTIPEAKLRACQLGFRAKFISDTARFLAARPGWLDETEALPYPAAKARLLELPGVGEKIADCVLLFGAGRLEAFPVDTWILQAMSARYGLTGWKPAQVAQFGRAHFGPLAGLAQQFLFAHERQERRNSARPASAPRSRGNP